MNIDYNNEYHSYSNEKVFNLFYLAIDCVNNVVYLCWYIISYINVKSDSSFPKKRKRHSKICLSKKDEIDFVTNKRNKIE